MRDVQHHSFKKPQSRTPVSRSAALNTETPRQAHPLHQQTAHTQRQGRIVLHTTPGHRGTPDNKTTTASTPQSVHHGSSEGQLALHQTRSVRQSHPRQVVTSTSASHQSRNRRTATGRQVTTSVEIMHTVFPRIRLPSHPHSRRKGWHVDITCAQTCQCASSSPAPHARHQGPQPPGHLWDYGWRADASSCSPAGHPPLGHRDGAAWPDQSIPVFMCTQL